jgi:hypothetical protein
MVLSCLFFSCLVGSLCVLNGCLVSSCPVFVSGRTLISALVSPPEWDDGCDRSLGKTKLHAYGDHYKNQDGDSEYRHPYDFDHSQQRRL